MKVRSLTSFQLLVRIVTKLLTPLTEPGNTGRGDEFVGGGGGRKGEGGGENAGNELRS